MATVFDSGMAKEALRVMLEREILVEVSPGRFKLGDPHLASSPAPTAPTATEPPHAPPGVGSFGALCNCSMAWVGMGRLIRAASGDCPVPDHEEDASEDP